MRSILGVVLGSVLINPAMACGQGQTRVCDAPETVSGMDRYNSLVCEGLRALEAGLNQQAIDRFEAALAQELPEVPNVQLFGRLAEAFWKAGDAERAGAALDKAEISLSVLVGIYRCTEQAGDFVILDRYGDALKGAHVSELAQRMCGGAFEPFYQQDSLEAVVHDADIIRIFLEARRMIRGK